MLKKETTCHSPINTNWDLDKRLEFVIVRVQIFQGVKTQLCIGEKMGGKLKFIIPQFSDFWES